MKKLSLLLLLFTAGLFGLQAQTNMLTGKITDPNNIPVPNASVKEKGTKNGVSADDQGSFKITVKAGATLIISSIGFDTKEVSVGSQSSLDISLVPDTKSISEVVVTGTGVATSKKKLGISVESISADKLPAAPTASIDQALVGKIPGAQISSVDGTPGARTNIVLRGINTIQGGTRPMILYDGVELGATDISALDLSNIERIEVVQGAAAATIYGAQGANGVIQLFTKKGKSGKTMIDFSSSYSNGSLINSGNLQKARLHSFRTDAGNNVVDGGGNIIQLTPYGTYAGVTWQHAAGNFVSAMGNPSNIANKVYDKNLRYYDHFKQLFQNAGATNNNLNISGGTGKSDFALTFSNFKQESNIKRNGSVNRTNFTANIGTELAKGLKIRSITQLAYTNNSLNPFYGVGRNNIYNMLNINPFYDLEQRLPDGTYPIRLTTGTVAVNGFNPFYYTDYCSGLDRTVDVVQNVLVNYKLNKFVELEGKYGINHQKQDINWVFQNQTRNISSIQWLSSGINTGWAGTFNQNDNTGEINNFAYSTTTQNLVGSAYIRTDFEKDFNLKIPITTSTQITYDYRRNNYSQYITYGQTLPTYPVYNLNQTSTQAVPSAAQLFTAGIGDGSKGGDYKQTFITYGYLVNQKIDVGEYGGLSAGFRTDYSSAFGKGSAPFTFPRGDIYVRPSSFNFWKNAGIGNLITEWKLRAAYGEAGIQPGAYDRQVTLPNSNIGNSTAFSLQYVQTNPDLSVELSKEFEAGTDFTFKGLKSNWFPTINFGLTYWNRKSENVIYQVDVPPSQGANSIKDNAIFLSSHGLQASLNMSVFKNSNVNWDFTTNFSRQTSQIDKIIGPNIVLTASAGTTTLVLTPGQKIGQLYGYKAFTSMDERRLDGTPYIDKADYGKYQMVNGYVVDTATKGIQFTNDIYPFGDPNPKFNASFINSISYNDYFNLSFQVDWVYGSHLYNQTKEWLYRDGIHSDFDVPVTINGRTAAYTAYYRSVYADYFGVQNGARNATKDFFYEDASFARLRNVSLSFDIARYFNMKAFRKLQLVLSGRNLVTITKYTGFDPEISSAIGNNSSWDRGIDHNSMPNIRSYQVALNIGL
ncbi:MAG: SusC/RagA family TonB-linked outer membrane protein [Bacteroidota bacterium]